MLWTTVYTYARCMITAEERDFFRKVRERLAKERAARGITQEQLAADSGLDRAHVSWIEQGRRNPNLVTLRRLCKGLGIKLADLLRGL